MQQLKNMKKGLAVLLPLAFILMPETALAAGGGLGSVTEFLKEIATAVFTEWGYYIAILGVGVSIWAGFAGHMEWRNVFKVAVLVVVFFAVPEFVSRLRDSASGAL